MDGRNRFLLQCPATVNVKMLFISPLLSLSPLLIWWREPHSSAINSICDVTNTHTTLESFRHCPTKTHTHTHRREQLTLVCYSYWSDVERSFLFYSSQSPGRKCKESNSKRRGSRGLVLSKFPPLWGFLFVITLTLSVIQQHITRKTRAAAAKRTGTRKKDDPTSPQCSKKKKGKSNRMSTAAAATRKWKFNWIGQIERRRRKRWRESNWIESSRGRRLEYIIKTRERKR